MKTAERLGLAVLVILGLSACGNPTNVEVGLRQESAESTQEPTGRRPQPAAAGLNSLECQPGQKTWDQVATYEVPSRPPSDDELDPERALRAHVRAHRPEVAPELPAGAINGSEKPARGFYKQQEQEDQSRYGYARGGRVQLTFSVRNDGGYWHVDGVSGCHGVTE